MTIQDIKQTALEKFDNKFLESPDSDIGWIVKSDINPIFLETVTNKRLKKEVKQFLSTQLDKLEEEVRKETINDIKEVFNNWCGDSQYVTGSWNTGETDLDSEKKGDEYWNWWSKTAWKQFYDYYLKSLKKETNNE